jgi:hypothetical protein
MEDQVEYNVIYWNEPMTIEPYERFYKTCYSTKDFQQAMDEFDKITQEGKKTVNFHCEVYKAITKYERIEVL